MDPRPSVDTFDSEQLLPGFTERQSLYTMFLWAWWGVGGFLQGLSTGFSISVSHATQITQHLDDDTIATHITSVRDFLIQMRKVLRELREKLRRGGNIGEIQQQFQVFLGLYAEVNDAITGGRIVESVVPPGLMIRSIDARTLSVSEIRSRLLSMNARLLMRIASVNLEALNDNLDL